LTVNEIVQTPEALTVQVTYSLPEALQSRLDGRVFVHLYADENQPPVAQVDRYPLDGASPPGTWLVGAQADTLVVNLTGIPSADYTLMLGFYEALTGERFAAQSAAYTVLADGRVVLGNVTIGE
jgi:hypothetical protein